MENSSVDAKSDSDARTFVALVTGFLDPSFKEAGKVLADRVRLFRMEQQLKLLDKADKIIKSRALSRKAVNLRVLLPLLETGSLEEDENMTERWAALLANAADANNKTQLESSFIEILKQLPPKHAFLLDVFYEQEKRDNLPSDKWSENGYVLSDLKSFLKEEVPEFDVALENLLRLKLVSHPTGRLGIANGQEVRIELRSSNILCPTSLGYSFVSACGHGRTPRNHTYGVPSNSIANAFWTNGGSIQLWDREQEFLWENSSPRKVALSHTN
jgi:hypothetical protein